MKVEWFCQIMGSEVGPLSQAELVDMVRNNKLNPEDLVRRNSSAWVAAFEVKGLFEAASVVSRTSTADRKQETPKKIAVHSPSKPPSRPRKVRERTDESLAKGKLPTDPRNCADWYCIASGEKKGPLEFDELRTLVRDGLLRQSDRVWRSSAPKFRKANEVEGLSN